MRYYFVVYTLTCFHHIVITQDYIRREFIQVISVLDRLCHNSIGNQTWASEFV